MKRGLLPFCLSAIALCGSVKFRCHLSDVTCDLVNESEENKKYLLQARKDLMPSTAGVGCLRSRLLQER